MGTTWSVQVIARPPSLAVQVEHVLGRIVAQMSHWEPGSTISAFNRTEPGVWRDIPPEFSRVLATAEAVGRASAGAFDPAIGDLADLWGFGPSGAQPAPDQRAVTALLGGRIEHDAAQLRARRFAPAALDFSGIAKGYAVDAVAVRLRELGLTDFLVEIGGEFVGDGVRPDGQPWWVEVETVPGAPLETLRVALHGLAIATSGDYRRFFDADGCRFAHTLDPRTGKPLRNGVASVTVLHRECMLADAWATALTVLGPEEGSAVAEREGLAMQMVVRGRAGVRELISPALREMLD